MQIQIDSREKARAVARIQRGFDNLGVTHFVSKLYVGDYMSLDNPRLVIDRKQNLSEVYGNLCQGKERFVGELERAIEAQIRLVILVEHGDGIQTLDDVKRWYNPRLDSSPYAWDGNRLYHAMRKIEKGYNTKFLFCNKADTASRIVELLGGV